LNLPYVFNRYFRRAGESHEAIASGEARHTLQEGGMANTVKIDIYADPSKPNPTLSLPDVPWYAGIIYNHMVSRRRLDRVFHALADQTRRDMLGRLKTGTCNITELAAPLHMTYAAASKHVRVLEQAGLIRRRRKGRSQECRLQPLPLERAYKWLHSYEKSWNAVGQVLE
jgi:DNA-binding transcriptional ArsR family regulator